MKWFNSEKGFGFVELEGGGGDAFLHISVLSRAGYQVVSPGATLRVLTSAGQKGPQVAEVVNVDESTATPGGAPGGGGGYAGGGAGGGGYSERPRPSPRAPVDMSSAVEMRLW